MIMVIKLHFRSAERAEKKKAKKAEKAALKAAAAAAASASSSPFNLGQTVKDMLAAKAEEADNGPPSPNKKTRRRKSR
jgi:hypothetical protein